MGVGSVNTYFVSVTLVETIEAEDKDAAFDQMMDLINQRDGMEIASHRIDEET